jgi:hypothetical protein
VPSPQTESLRHVESPVEPSQGSGLLKRKHSLIGGPETKVPPKSADSFYVSSLAETPTLYSPAALAALIRDFDREPVANRKRITEFLQYQPEIFYLAAIEIVRKDMESRAAQYLVALLVHGNLLFRAVCDPAVDRERATELARQAFRGDPTVDVKLARQLADASAGESGLEPGMAERLLEIIDEISDGKRILPSLMRMLRNENPYLRSKAVLMIGRGGRSLQWIKKRIQEADTRVRANAIEAVWGIESDDARELLLWATRDSNNRVVGNALIGLYRLGETSALTELIKMAGHSSPAFRRTAAWVMGHTADPRYTEILGRMLADANTDVRKSAFQAVRRIRAAAAEVAQTSEWQCAATAGPKNPRVNERRVSAAVLTADGRGSPRVLPTEFHLSEDGQPVWIYRVAEKMAPGPLSVLFLFPRKLNKIAQPWDQGALQCLKWKRSTDLWSAVPYSGTAPQPAASELELPTFIASASQAARAFEETTKRVDCTGFWTAVNRAVLPGNTQTGGQRHMIVIAPGDVGEPADAKLLTAVQASRTSIQVISTAANPALQEFCQRVEGRFYHVTDSSSIENAVSQAYLSLLARYEIRYQPVSPGATSLKIRVHTAAGWGETTAAL